MDSVGVLGLAFLRGPRLIPLYVCSSIALNFGSCTVTMYMLRSCLAYFGRLDFGLCVVITYRVKYQIITSAITVTSVSGHSFHVLAVIKNCYSLMCPRLHRHTTMVRCLGLGNTRRRINPKHTSFVIAQLQHHGATTSATMRRCSGNLATLSRRPLL